VLEYAECLRAAPENEAPRGYSSRITLLDALRVVLAVLLIPELPRLLWHTRTHLPWQMRGMINSEYLVLLALAWLFPSWRMIALLVGELVIVGLEPVAALYNVPLPDTLRVIGNLTLLPAGRLALYGSLLILYGATCALLLRLSVGLRRRPFARPLAATLLILAILPLLADIAEGRFYEIHLSGHPSDLDRLLPYQASAMPVFQLAKDVVLANGSRNTGAPSPHPLPSTLSHAIDELPAGSSPDIVLVLTESWGLADDDRVNQAEYRPYLSPAITEHYHVEIGSTQFQGGTIAGEFRELCGQARGFDVLAEPADHLQTCWPAKLARAGYSTVAVHGFTSLMFNRQNWYSRFGFQNKVFLEDLSRKRLARCDGAFNGICDASVAGWIGDRLLAARGPGPTYVHWVTLNTHLPIAPLAGSASRQECAAADIDGETSLCSWFDKTLIVHHSVAGLATRPGLRPTVFVIVGDHAPPFMNADFRSRFSSTDVPYIILMPKSL